MAFPSDKILALHAAAIVTGLDRDALLAGIDKRFVATIPYSPARSAQLLQDLYVVSSAGRLANGSDPFRTWLVNAVGLAGFHREARTFEEALRIVDPEFAQSADPPPASKVEVDWKSGENVVPVPPRAVKAGTTRHGPKSLFEELSYPFWLPSAVRLRDLLVGAYQTINGVEYLARTVPISLTQWDRGGGAIEPAWNALLDLASKQQMLETLIGRVLADPQVRAYHQAIRECLGLPS